MFEQSSKEKFDRITFLHLIFITSISTWFLTIITSNMLFWFGCSVPTILVSSEFLMSAVGTHYLIADILIFEKKSERARLNIISQILGVLIAAVALSTGTITILHGNINIFSIFCIIIGSVSIVYRAKERKIM